MKAGKRTKLDPRSLEKILGPATKLTWQANPHQDETGEKHRLYDWYQKASKCKTIAAYYQLLGHHYANRKLRKHFVLGYVKVGGAGDRARVKQALAKTTARARAKTLALSKLSPATKLTWLANPKQKNSMAYKRYAKYSKSKTLAEFHKFEHTKGDLLNDLARGYVKLEAAANRTVLAKRASLAEVKIACLGDSNTTGSGLGKDSYPNRLQALLRHNGYRNQGPLFGTNKVLVSEFGVSGVRAVHAARRIAYISQDKFKAALAWKADIYVVMLGTNDAHQGSGQPEKVEKALEELTDKVKNSIPEAVVLLVLPPGGGEAGAESDHQSRQARCTSSMDKIYPGIRRLALKSDYPAIDPALRLGHIRSDGIHLTKKGAKRVALKVWTVVNKVIAKKKWLKSR